MKKRIIKKIAFFAFFSLGFLNLANAAELKKSELKILKGNSEVKEFGCENITGLAFKPINSKTKIEFNKNVFKKESFYEGSKFSCSLLGDPIENKVEIQRLETAHVNGATIEVYHGRGTAEITPSVKGSESDRTWLASCRKDAMTDQNLCGLRIKNLSIYSLGDNSYSLYVGSVRHFPNRQTMIRVDGNKAFSTTDDDGAMSESDSEKIISQIKNGSKVLIRYYEWPNDYPVDAEIDTAVFNEAMQAYKNVEESF